MVRRFIGLDVHKRVVEACAVDPKGAILWRHRFGALRADLASFAKRLFSTDRVALEATTNTWAVVEVIRPVVEEVVVSNPIRTRAIAEAKIKTDKVDAHVLAQLLRCDYLPSVWVPEQKTQDLRQLVGRRAALVGNRTAIMHRIKSALAQKLIVPDIGKLVGPKGRQLISEMKLDPQTRLLVDSDLALLTDLERQMDIVGRELRGRAYEDERIKLLITLPGVDVTVAQAMLAAWGDPGRFRDADHAAAYLGLVPSTKQSASTCYHGPITKQGNRRARVMLVQAAQHLADNPGPLGFFFRRLAKKKNRQIAVVATARKLAVIAWHLLKHGEPYRYALPHQTAPKLARLRTLGGGPRRARGQQPETPARQRTRGVRTKTVPSLPEIYRCEGVPVATPPDKLRPGERDALARTKLLPFVQSLQQEKRQILKQRDADNTASRSATRKRKVPAAARRGPTPAPRPHRPPGKAAREGAGSSARARASAPASAAPGASWKAAKASR